MALRDQPYLPLYIQDFITDEKLIECSASATGVYIRLMCVMHKSKEYGCVLLKQKYKQIDNQSNNFALQLDRQMPYSINEIQSGIEELINEGVIILVADKLTQPRMVKDNDISLKRSIAGKKGGESTQFAKAKPEPNPQASSEYESENEFKFVNELKDSKELYEKITFAFWQLFDFNMQRFGVNSTDLIKAKSKIWVDNTRKMIEIDKRSEKDIAIVYGYLKSEEQNKGFAWAMNIRSTDKLRKNFEKILIKARNIPGQVNYDIDEILKQAERHGN